MKAVFIGIVVSAGATATWAQAVGPCSSQSLQQGFEDFCRVIQTDRSNSLAHYRIAEALFLQRNFQSAANEFREALSGSLDPRWTEVWSHIYLAKVFNLTDQRQRALNEYELALRTGDNTLGAQDETVKLLKEMEIDDPSGRAFDSLARATLERIRGDYTDEARIAELEGTVLLEGDVGEDGLARGIRVLRTLGLGLDERAIESVRQRLFMPRQTSAQGSIRAVIAVDFFLPSKVSRWHLIHADFAPPPGSARPVFLSAGYPAGAGVFGREAIDEGRLLGALGRQAWARVSFEIDEHGVPVNIQSGATSEAAWGPQAAALVSGWRFTPGSREGKPTPAGCSVDLVWGPRILTPATAVGIGSPDQAAGQK